MAKQTTGYLVTMDGTTEEFTTISKAVAYAGIKGKVTKAEIEEGKYPMITIGQLQHDEELDLQYKADLADQEAQEEAKALASKDEDRADMAKHQALQAIEEAMNAVDDSIHADLFDRLCELEDAINDGASLTDAQAILMTQVLTNTYMDNTDTEDLQEDDNEDKPVATAKPTKADVEYPEVGDFKDEKAMKKFIKGLSDESLEEWCILEGAIWKHNDHQSINRMRMAMAIKAIHFPDTAPKATSKKKSKYGHYSNEELVQMALDNDISVPDDKGDLRIMRMYTIMALKKAGLIE